MESPVMVVKPLLSMGSAGNVQSVPMWTSAPLATMETATTLDIPFNVWPRPNLPGMAWPTKTQQNYVWAGSFPTLKNSLFHKVLLVYLSSPFTDPLHPSHSLPPSSLFPQINPSHTSVFCLAVEIGYVVVCPTTLLVTDQSPTQCVCTFQVILAFMCTCRSANELIIGS